VDTTHPLCWKNNFLHGYLLEAMMFVVVVPPPPPPPPAAAQLTMVDPC